jgi:hypothetical protein
MSPEATDSHGRECKVAVPHSETIATHLLRTRPCLLQTSSSIQISSGSRKNGLTSAFVALYQ